MEGRQICYGLLCAGLGHSGSPWTQAFSARCRAQGMTITSLCPNTRRYCAGAGKQGFLCSHLLKIPSLREFLRQQQLELGQTRQPPLRTF